MIRYTEYSGRLNFTLLHNFSSPWIIKTSTAGSFFLHPPPKPPVRVVSLSLSLRHSQQFPLFITPDGPYWVINSSCLSLSTPSPCCLLRRLIRWPINLVNSVSISIPTEISRLLSEKFFFFSLEFFFIPVHEFNLTDWAPEFVFRLYCSGFTATKNRRDAQTYTTTNTASVLLDHELSQGISLFQSYPFSTTMYV